MWQQVKLSDVSLRTSPRDSLGTDEGVKKPNKQTKRKSTTTDDSYHNEYVDDENVIADRDDNDNLLNIEGII